MSAKTPQNDDGPSWIVLLFVAFAFLLSVLFYRLGGSAQGHQLLTDDLGVAAPAVVAEQTASRHDIGPTPTH
jgi:hypothetical protein